MASQTVDIADDTSKDNGFAGSVAVARSRLRIDARKWLASKLAPKKYGDKIDATPSGTPFHAPAFAARLAGDIVPDLDVWFPRKLAFLREPHRYKVLYGGRGGIKS